MNPRLQFLGDERLHPDESIFGALGLITRRFVAITFPDGRRFRDDGRHQRLSAESGWGQQPEANMREWVLAALLAAISIATPAASPAKQPVPQASAPQQGSSANARGTDAQPLVVQVQAAPADAAKAKAEQTEKDEHAHAERLIANGTVALAGITAILAIATIVLAIFTFKLWSETKNLREGADHQAKEVATQNTRQLSIAGRQLRLLTEQEKLQRLQFLATHRPKVLVRRIEFVRAEGGPEMVRYTVQNIGSNRCEIIKTSATIWRPKERELWPSSNDYGRVREDPIELNGGESKASTNSPSRELLAELAFDFGYVKANGSGDGGRTFFIGFLKYKDDAGVVRETGFLRRFIWETSSFVVVQHPDYEYQD